MDNSYLTYAAARFARHSNELERIAKAGLPIRSFKVGVLTSGDADWVFNGMRYRFPEVADKAAESIACRWTAVRATIVLPSEDEANTDESGNLLPLS